MSRRVVAAAGLALILVPRLSPAQEVGYTGSIYVGRGTYPGVERVTSVYVFNSVDLTTKRFRGSVSVPFISRRTTGATASDGSLSANGSSFTETVTGLGDPLIRLDLRVLDDRVRGVQVGVSGSVKLPAVHAEGGLGTGMTDVAVGGSLSTFRGATSMFADVMFWKYGDPEGVDFSDVLSYGLGLGRVIGAGRWSALVSFAGFSKGLEGQAPPMQLNMTALRLMSRRQSLAITAGVGLNESADKLSIGASWRIAR